MGKDREFIIIQKCIFLTNISRRDIILKILVFVKKSWQLHSYSSKVLPQSTYRFTFKIIKFASENKSLVLIFLGKIYKFKQILKKSEPFKFVL